MGHFSLKNQSVTAESYLRLLQEEFITEVQENEVFGEMWFMQDGQ